MGELAHLGARVPSLIAGPWRTCVWNLRVRIMDDTVPQLSEVETSVIRSRIEVSGSMRGGFARAINAEQPAPLTERPNALGM